MAARGRGIVTESVDGIAGADFSESPYRLGRMAGTNIITPWVTKAASLTAAVFGIIQTQVASGEAVSLATRGQPFLFCSSPVNHAALLTASASAGAIPAASGDIVIAKALEAGVTGQFLAVQMLDPFRLAE
jgi:predicted short-subunit dehydrogenase-like oxidoreductase (DUF2520 family)